MLGHDMVGRAQANRWNGHGIVLMLALLALAVPRLITAAPLDMLEAPRAAIDPAEEAGANFPGSAFFYAQGAFDPVPGALTVQSEHVMGLDAVTAAPALAFRGLTGLDSYRALNCLTSAIYYEAANEPDDGQRAVAQVVLNRVRSTLWPNTVCGVVYQGSERADFKCQFTFSCDGSMARLPSAAAWTRARRVAQQALAGAVYQPVGLATHYHTLAVRPLWSSSLQPVAVIGAHIFYRNLGYNGTPAAFRTAYMGRETISGPARTLWPARPVAPVELLAPPYASPSTPSYSGPSYSGPSYSGAPNSGTSYSGSAARGPSAAWTPLSSARPTSDGLPESTIRPEYRTSGRPRT